ncbi:MAG: hypothetical protein ABIQ44_05675 [Chloroflexia bacterium]
MRTANIASALFVLGLLISGNLAGGGVQPSNLVLASIIASPTSSFSAEIYLPETAADFAKASSTDFIIKTLRIEIDAKDGLQSCYSVANLTVSSTSAGTKIQPEDTQRTTDSLYGLNRSSDVAVRPTVTGLAYLDGSQVAHSLFRYDSIKAPDIPTFI